MCQFCQNCFLLKSRLDTLKILTNWLKKVKFWVPFPANPSQIPLSTFFAKISLENLKIWKKSPKLSFVLTRDRKEKAVFQWVWRLKEGEKKISLILLPQSISFLKNLKKFEKKIIHNWHLLTLFSQFPNFHPKFFENPFSKWNYRCSKWLPELWNRDIHNLLFQELSKTVKIIKIGPQLADWPTLQKFPRLDQ